MDNEINRIRLCRLYSENKLFDDIVFHDGINLILGEKYDESIIKGRKTNGVGKSLSIDFLNFCLLSDYNYSRLKKVPEEVFGMDENIVLDMEIGSDKFTIKRNRKEEEARRGMKGLNSVILHNVMILQKRFRLIILCIFLCYI